MKEMDGFMVYIIYAVGITRAKTGSLYWKVWLEFVDCLGTK